MDGAEWISSRGELFLTGTAPYCKASTWYGQNPHTWSLTGEAWAPQFHVMTRRPRVAYDEDLDRLYTVTKNSVESYDVSNGYAPIDSKSILSSHNGTADLDRSGRWLYWTVGHSNQSVRFGRMHVPETGPMGIEESLASVEVGNTMRVNQRSGRVLFWDGGSTVTEYDPIAQSFADIEAVGETGPPPSSADGYNYGRWRCFSAALLNESGADVSPGGACVAISHPSDGVWVFKVPES